MSSPCLAMFAAVVLAGSAASVSASAAEEQAPAGASPSAGASGDLSHRLNQSNGVIQPPRNVDPKMSAPVPTPHPHTTPVIPPPGSPGGDPNVQPK